MTKDLLIRTATTLAILACAAYFAFGVAAGAAAYQPGTAIHHDDPVSFAMLGKEVWRVPFVAVLPWFPTFVGPWFVALLAVALTMALNPRLFFRSRRAFVVAGSVLGLGWPVGTWGLVHLLYAVLNTLWSRRLDGEWVIEEGPVFEAVGLLYLIACLLLIRNCPERDDQRPRSGEVAESVRGDAPDEEAGHRRAEARA